MPTVVHQHELEEPDRFDLDDFEFDDDQLLKVTSSEGTEEVYSPDEACDLICNLVEEQFWDWFTNAARGRRFKPRIKVYEVW